MGVAAAANAMLFSFVNNCFIGCRHSGQGGGGLQATFGRPSTLIGIPFDRPVVGFGGHTINTLRLWAASTPDYFDFEEFSHGERSPRR